MKRTIRCGLGLATFFIVACSIRADVMPFLRGRDHRFDRPPAPKKIPVHIESSPNGPQVRLVIPRKFLSAVNPWASNQAPGQNLVAWGRKAIPLGAGLALCLVLLPLGLGRIWIHRLAVAIGLILTLTGTVFLSQSSQAHTCPPPIRPFTLTGQVTVEFADEGDAIRLIFNRNEQFNINSPWIISQ